MKEGESLEKYLNQALEKADKELFIEALEDIKEARKLAQGSDEALGVIDAREEEIKEKRRRCVQTLTDELEKHLAKEKEPERANRGELEKGQEVLARLKSFHPDRDTLDRLAERWGNYRRRAEMLLDLEETHRTLEDLWSAGSILLSKYDEARILARRKAELYPDDPMADFLLEEAEKRREEAYRLEGVLTTQAAEGDFKELMEELKRLREQGVESLPRYDWGLKEIEGKPTRIPVARRDVPANDAIIQLAKLAHDFQESKAREYKQKAQNDLPADPKTAARWIEDALAFDYISENMQNELQAFRDQKIRPALQKREQAESLVAEALKPGRDIEDAWKRVEEAYRIDSHSPEIERARDEVRPDLRLKLEGDLSQANERLEEGDFDTAEGIANRVRELAESDNILQGIAKDAEFLVAKCRADRRLLKEVEDEAKYIEQELVGANPAAAEQALSELEARVQSRPAPFQRALRSARSGVQSRQSLEERLAEWRRRFRKIDPRRLDMIEDIPQAVRDLGYLIEDIEDYDAQGEEPRLTRLQSQVMARRDLLEGHLKREEGFYQRAKEAWQRVEKAKEAAAADLSLAHRWLEEIEDAAPVSEALKKAEEYQNEKKYREALETLREWRTKSSPKQQEVETRYRRIEDEWVGQLKTEIEELGGGRIYEGLDEKLKDKIKELASLRLEQAQPYRHRLFPRVYEALGDLAWRIAGHLPEAEANFEKAAENFKQAAEWARGEEQVRLMIKERKVRQEQVRDKVEKLSGLNKLGEARDELLKWISRFSGDVPCLVELVELFLKDANYKQANNYIRWAERSLDAAEREIAPLRAGLEREEDITEWQSRLKVLRFKAEEVTNVAVKKKFIEERLQPTSRLEDYRLAQETKQHLIETLGKRKEEVQERKIEHPHRAWEEVERWVDGQCSEVTGIPAWYNRMERELMEKLQREWKQTEAPGAKIEFRKAPPSKNLEQRWPLGIKINYISRHGSAHDSLEAGKQTLQEITELTLDLNLQDWIGDFRGPEEDLEGRRLLPLDSLEIQLAWSRIALSWAELLRDTSQRYTKVIGEEPSKREDAVKICNKIEQFIEELSELRRAVHQVRRRLEQTVSAGQGRRWERVNWYEIIPQLLLSLPLSEEAKRIVGGKDNQDQRRAYWRGLEDNDPEMRWRRWKAAAEMLQQENLSTDPRKAPWTHIINRIIIQAGLEEKWNEILDPLSAYQDRFGRRRQVEHRVVTWLRWEGENAEELRNRLVLLMIELHTFVQAEDFIAALKRMEQMDSRDREDKYGFRSGYLMRGFPDGVPLPWVELEKKLQALKREWEKYQEWWKKVKQSALTSWQKETRVELISLVRRADFKGAKELAEDALVGAQGNGRTGRLGGGLALVTLWKEHLKTLPDLELTSHSLRQVEEEVARCRHDVSEAIEELLFLLQPELEKLELEEVAIRHRVRDFDMSLDDYESEFEAGKGALHTAYNGLVTTKRRREKETQRQYCLELLEELRKLAPEWPDLETWRQKIREA